MIRVLSQYVSPKSLLLIFFEAVFVSLGLLCGARLRFWASPAEFRSYVQAPEFALQAVTFVTTLQVCFLYFHLYDLNITRRRQDHLIGVCQSLGAASLLLGILYFVCPWLLIGRGVFFISVVVAASLVVPARVALDRAWHVAAPRQNVLILGTEELAITAMRELTRRRDLNLALVGFLDAMSETSAIPNTVLCGYPVLGSMEQLGAVVEKYQISRIVIAMENRRGALPVWELVKLKVQGVNVEDAHSIVAALSGRIWLDMVHPSWFVFTGGFRRSRLMLLLKRTIDLVFGLVGLTLSSPVMLLIAIAIRLESSGPVIYRQARVGLKGKPFELLKFRSMRADAEGHGGAQWAQRDDPRVTRIGAYLRKYRLDELPQFVNIVRGDMSFVGPRPERPVFVERLRELISYYDERHSVRPGLTGWAQVQYSYGASVEDTCRKLEYDLFYLKSMSVLFDVVIIFKTVRTILTGAGAR